MSWNKGSLELENGSRILASSTSASAVRGGSYNIIFLDEFAYVPSNVAEQFFSSVYPTISSGKTTKVMIVSTPHGMNMFYKLWVDAEEQRNEYIPIEVHWSEVPGRDEAWKKQTINNTSQAQFNTEFECEFLGSIDTLIAPHKLKQLTYRSPKQSSGGLDVHIPPQADHTIPPSMSLRHHLAAARETMFPKVNLCQHLAAEAGAACYMISTLCMLFSMLNDLA